MDIFQFTLLLPGLFLLLTGGIGYLAWRGRALWYWQRALRNELHSLEAQAFSGGAERQAALQYVLKECLKVWRSSDPCLGKLAFDALYTYVRRIALFYHSSEAYPERQLRVVTLLDTLRLAGNACEQILARPGFGTLRSLRVRQIRALYSRYRYWRGHFLVRIYFRYRPALQRFTRVRLVLLPEPLSWLGYLSGRLLTLTLIKLLVVEVYLHIGRLAAWAYAQDADAQESPLDLESVLDALNHSASEQNFDEIHHPEIRAIRAHLVGWERLLHDTPDTHEWWVSVQKMADIVAHKYFPQSPSPLAEAALGPLLQRLQIGLSELSKLRSLPVVKYLLYSSLDTLYQRQQDALQVLTPEMYGVLNKLWQHSMTLHALFSAYRLLRRATPTGLALQAGWFLFHKSLIRVVYARTFDRAYAQAEKLYLASALEAWKIEPKR